jgi:hypothetical protein
MAWEKKMVRKMEIACEMEMVRKGGVGDENDEGDREMKRWR